MFEDSDIKNVFSDPTKISYAANKYNMLLCEGLAENGVHVTAYSFLPVTSKNCNKLFIRGKRHVRGNLNIVYPFTVNLPALKHIQRGIAMFFRTLFSPKKSVVIFDLYALSANLGMNIAAKIRGFDKICILTDLPEFLTENKRLLKIENGIISDADAYVLLTNQMAEKINAGGKPKIVLEGHVDSKMTAAALPVKNTEQRNVVYAGALNKRYGIAELVDAFISCRKPNEFLHLYGPGDYVKDIIEISKRNSGVKYMGVKPNTEIVDAEMHAALLVNPRTSAGEYTKYSFPSKVLEYMSSGTPVLMARLPGIPDEYYEYVYTFDDSDTGGLAAAIRQVLDKDPDEIIAAGLKAREFVLKNKNNIAQAEKILGLPCFNRKV